MSAAETPEPVAGQAAPGLLSHGLRIESESAPSPAVGQDAWTEENFFRVVLNLEGGEWVEVGSFGDEDGAEACARELVGQLAERRWPRVKSRYLRPETILSVEVSARRRYTGSADRTSWGHASS
jgi:hypothetical protein